MVPSCEAKPILGRHVREVGPLAGEQVVCLELEMSNTQPSWHKPMTEVQDG